MKNKKEISFTTVWKQTKIFDWEIRYWVDDFRGLIHHIYLAVLFIIILLVMLVLK